MRSLTAPGAFGAADTLRPLFDALDRRLDPTSPAPLALGLSGGSDSLALLELTLSWAQACGRRVLALTVDHRLHPDSAAWTAAAGALAGGLGADWRALAWEGPKPSAGLPAAARRARHALLAEAARHAGASVLLLGHTADDRAESEVIRKDTPTHGRLGEWAPSPVWPEGRDLFLCRPLLEVRRQTLRDRLQARGLSWLEDPANEDARYARTRARAALRPETVVTSAATPPRLSSPARLIERAGLLSLEGVGLLAAASPADALAKALVCAGGGERPPRGSAVARLLKGLRGGTAFASALAGARMAFDGARLTLSREMGRAHLEPALLPPDQTVVFDGRFEVTAYEPNWRIAPLAGHARRLPKRERESLRALAPEARPALPVLLAPDGAPRLPALLGGGPARVRSLVLRRLEAALGLYATEAQLRAARMQESSGETSPVILS